MSAVSASFSVGSAVSLYGRVDAVVVGFSSNGKNVHVVRSDGSDTWVSTSKVKAV